MVETKEPKDLDDAFRNVLKDMGRFAIMFLAECKTGIVVTWWIDRDDKLVNDLERARLWDTLEEATKHMYRLEALDAWKTLIAMSDVGIFDRVKLGVRELWEGG